MTRQIRDTLLFEGEEYRLNDELLERYFMEYPDRKPRSEIVMTALWRGYIATFEIAAEELLIKDLEVFSSSEKWSQQLPIDKAFPSSKKFDWFSGLIRIDEFRGEFDEEEPGFVFKFLEVLNGNLVKVRIMNYEELQQFKKEQFGYFKLSNDYEKALTLWRSNNEGITNAKIDGYIPEHILSYTREVFVD